MDAGPGARDETAHSPSPEDEGLDWYDPYQNIVWVPPQGGESPDFLGM
jgi:hypothetical protein